MTAYHTYADAHRERSRHTDMHNWSLQMARLPDGGEGTGHLAVIGGIPHLGWHTPPWDRVDKTDLWHDVDAHYVETRQWLERRSRSGSS